MVVDRDTLKKILHGYLYSAYDAKGSLHLYRFTKRQQAVYLAKGEKTLGRCNASASIYLDFITDSDFLRMTFDTVSGSAVSYMGFDLYVDGVFTENRSFNDCHIPEIWFALPQGTHRITLYFPWSCKVAVHTVELSENAAIKPVNRAHRAMAFGDSITQGYTTMKPSFSYVNMLSRELDVEIINQGVGGFYFDENTIDEELSAYAPEFLLIAYGTNDFSKNSDPETFRNNASSYIDKFCRVFRGRKIYGILPIFRSDSSITDPATDARYSFQDAKRMLTEIYQSHPGITIIHETGIPHIREAFAQDCVHPVDLGHILMANGIARYLELP